MIPRLWVDNYTAGINAISKNAREKLSSLLLAIDMEQDVATVREQVVPVMQGVCGTSTQGAAMLSAQFYNGIRKYELGETIGATFDSGREPKATEGAVRAFAQKLVEGKQDEFVDACLDRADYEVKVAAAQTCVNNAKRDPKKPRFARVPAGEDTCEFCIMLASRGFVYHTEVTASHAHANCDCRIIPSWESEEVEGYDPDDLYRQWKELKGSKNTVGHEVSSGARYEDMWLSQFKPEVATITINGEEIYRKVGTPNESEFPIDAPSGYSYRDLDLHHTHTTPISGTFSREDIETTVNTMCKSHEVTHELTSIKYKLIRTDSVTDESATDFYSDFFSMYRELFENASYEYWLENCSKAGVPITLEGRREAMRSIQPLVDEWLDENAGKYGYQYTKTGG